MERCHLLGEVDHLWVCLLGGRERCPPNTQLLHVLLLLHLHLLLELRVRISLLLLLIVRQSVEPLEKALLQLVERRRVLGIGNDRRRRRRLSRRRNRSSRGRGNSRRDERGRRHRGRGKVEVRGRVAGRESDAIQGASGRQLLGRLRRRNKTCMIKINI